MTGQVELSSLGVNEPRQNGKPTCSEDDGLLPQWQVCWYALIGYVILRIGDTLILGFLG